MDLDVRGMNYQMEDELTDFVGDRVRSALRRFTSRIGRVMVQLSDENGPRGGADKRCRITVNLLPRGVVRVEGLGDDPFAVAARAAKRTGQTVHRILDRRRQARIGLGAARP